MGIDPRVSRRYEVVDEDARLWAPGRGDLVRLRTWDIFDRYLGPPGRVLDVGGGPGTHAAHLAARGYDVTLVDPMPRHVELARQRAEASDGASFEARVGDAREVPGADGTVDSVLLLGPLYHLVERTDRLAALAEAHRVLRPGGRLLAEAISRHAWVLDATAKDVLDAPDVWRTFQVNIETGLTTDPVDAPDGCFWAYMHRPDELRDEVEEAGFGDVTLVAVEGFAWLLGDLAARLADPDPILRAVRLTETEPSMLGCSAHVIAAATKR